MSRMDELLTSTARELQAGRAPLNAAWLDAHHVSLDEAIGLASHLATAIHVYRATMSLGLRLSGPADELTLPELVAGMSLRQGGPAAILAEAMRLEEEATNGADALRPLKGQAMNRQHRDARHKAPRDG